jgi:serine/threonine-protein kinase RsbW
MTTTTGSQASGTDDVASSDGAVVLVVPADPAYLAVLRTATAGMAARLDLDLDEIEDLRIAVDEACALLLVGARPADRLRTVFVLGDDWLQVEVSGPATELPATESIAWAVLEALVGEVDVREAAATAPARVRLLHRRRRSTEDGAGLT